MVTSLDILRPSPSPPTRRSSTAPRSRDLESRALKFADLMSTSSFTDPALKQLVVSDFQCQVELPDRRICLLRSRDEFINHYNKHSKTRLLDVSNVTTEIDEDGDRARVMLLMRIVDLPRGTPQEAVSVLWWK